MEATVGGVIATSFVAQHDWSTSSFFSVGDGDVMHEEGLLAHEAAACSIMDQEEENSGLKASCPSRTDSGVLDSGDQTPVCSFQRGGFMEMMEGCESSTASCTSSTHPSPAAHRRNADASAATILKWQQLLRDHPNDPMAFYWQEMVDWCNFRGNMSVNMPMPPFSATRQWDGDSGAYLLSPGVGKRQAHFSGDALVDDSCEVDLLNRLVKRCRCNDERQSPTPASHGSSSQLMWEAP